MADQDATSDDNRIIFEKVAKALFIDRDLEALADYVSDEEYIQHNPLLPDGKEAVMKFLKDVVAGSDHTSEIQHLVVDGDIGLVHCRIKGPNGEDLGVLVDMFRIRDGKLVEHWDVMTFKPRVG